MLSIAGKGTGFEAKWDLGVVSLHFGSRQGRVVKQCEILAVSVRCTLWALTLHSLYRALWFLLKLIQQIFIEHV